MANTRRPTRPSAALTADPEAETNAVIPAAVRGPRRPAPQPVRQASLIVIGSDDSLEEDEDGLVEVSLVGQVYRVKPPKAASAMRLAWLAAEKNPNPDELFSALDAWIEKAFGADQAEEVRRRMYDDDEDKLDFPHIMALMQKLIELQNGGTPTTRR